jgi:hypothetical protein
MSYHQYNSYSTMKYKYLIIAALILSSITARAQVLSGTVIETIKNTRLGNVFIKDITSKQVALTDDAGNFDIRTELNHTLIFSLSGYVSDTLYVIDFKPKHIELKLRGLSLSDVNIYSSSAPFNPESEYPEVYEKSKFALSPSRIFGKESRDARRLKRYFKSEMEQRQIDSIFTRALVSSVVPLKGRDLENFMTMYRPTLEFAKNSSQQTLTLYINDSYRKYMALPADKKGLPALHLN